MPLHCPITVPERILSFGGPGTGKTHDFFKIADWSQKTKSPARFWLVDTDATGARMLATDFQHLTNMNVLPSFDWQMVLKNYNTALSAVSQRGVEGREDWISVDLISPTWDWVQDYYTEQVFKDGLSSFFLQARIAMEEGKKKQGEGAFDGWKDWGIINKLYRDLTNLILQSPCHVYATAVADKVTDKDDRQIIDTFGPFGQKPKGQKHVPHLFHTALWKVMQGQGGSGGQWVMTTCKDRGRERHAATPVSDFVMQYLVKTAGWKVA